MIWIRLEQEIFNTCKHNLCRDCGEDKAADLTHDGETDCADDPLDVRSYVEQESYREDSSEESEAACNAGWGIRDLCTHDEQGTNSRRADNNRDSKRNNADIGIFFDIARIFYRRFSSLNKMYCGQEQQRTRADSECIKRNSEDSKKGIAKIKQRECCNDNGKCCTDCCFTLFFFRHVNGKRQKHTDHEERGQYEEKFDVGFSKRIKHHDCWHGFPAIKDNNIAGWYVKN